MSDHNILEDLVAAVRGCVPRCGLDGCRRPATVTFDYGHAGIHGQGCDACGPQVCGVGLVDLPQADSVRRLVKAGIL